MSTLSINLEALFRCISRLVHKVDVFIRDSIFHNAKMSCSKIEKGSSNVLEDVYFVQHWVC